MSQPELETPGHVTTEDVLWVLQQLVEPLAEALPKDSEVVLHDLRRLPASIIAVAGDVTGRRLGGSATDLLLRAAAAARFDTHVGYHTKLQDGRDLLSTTIVVRASSGEPAAALCINTDQSAWHQIQSAMQSLMPIAGSSAESSPTETFVTDVDELGQNLIAEAIQGAGVPVDLMKKPHKKGVVAELNTKGFFMLKESVDTAANALGVTRFTIYNYLNELAKEATNGATG